MNEKEQQGKLILLKEELNLLRTNKIIKIPEEANNIEQAFPKLPNEIQNIKPKANVVGTIRGGNSSNNKN